MEHKNVSINFQVKPQSNELINLQNKEHGFTDGIIHCIDGFIRIHMILLCILSSSFNHFLTDHPHYCDGPGGSRHRIINAKQFTIEWMTKIIFLYYLGTTAVKWSNSNYDMVHSILDHLHGDKNRMRVCKSFLFHDLDEKNNAIQDIMCKCRHKWLRYTSKDGREYLISFNRNFKPATDPQLLLPKIQRPLHRNLHGSIKDRQEVLENANEKRGDFKQYYQPKPPKDLKPKIRICDSIVANTTQTVVDNLVFKTSRLFKIENYAGGIKSFATLYKYQWLDDQVMNSVGKYIINQASQSNILLIDALFMSDQSLFPRVSFEQIQSLTFYIFLNPPKHWILAEISVSKLTITTFDSLPSFTDPYYTELLRELILNLSRVHIDCKWNVHQFLECSIQQNDYDCGIFSLLFLRKRIKNKRLNKITDNDAKLARRRYARLLLKTTDIGCRLLAEFNNKILRVLCYCHRIANPNVMNQQSEAHSHEEDIYDELKLQIVTPEMAQTVVSLPIRMSNLAE